MKIEPNAKGSHTFDTHVGLLMLTINQVNIVPADAPAPSLLGHQ